ncbi:hypothetical protein ACU80R_20610 [Pandoraea sputorum]
MLFAIGALNGGTALASSVWDGLVTAFKNIMSSTYLIALVMIILVVLVWQLAHGGGYRMAGLVLGVLVVGLIAPDLATSVATATGSGGFADTGVSAPAAPHALTNGVSLR